jgi:dCMP deaminase
MARTKTSAKILRKSQEKWDARYLDLAKLVGEWSKDPRAKVGAAIVNPKLGRLIAVGFNGFPSNVEDDVRRLEDQKLKLTMTIHAEQNALIFAGKEARDCDAYVVGKPVCSMCATLLIQAGVKRVIAAEPRLGTASKWDKAGLLSIEIFREAGVEFRKLTEAEMARLGLDADSATRSLPPSGTIFVEGDEVEL